MVSTTSDGCPDPRKRERYRASDRWTTNGVQRSVRIMLAIGYKGMCALEYEDGPWDGVEGSK
jgi:hypothetical protein